MSKLEKLKEKARGLEAKDPRGAIEAWLEILNEQDAAAEPNPDLSIFNRIGDLYLKVKDPAQAADYYDRAVDRYAELGFHNNAIAMCNKVLRNAPGRQTTYLKLAKLYASKGFMGEAKQNFLEYAERMHRGGKIQQAFAALKEFADLSPEGAHLRQTLGEHLRMYGGSGAVPGPGAGAGDTAGAAAARGPAVAPPAPRDDPAKSGKRKTSHLVFLDVDAPAVPKPPGSRVGPPPQPVRAPEPEPEPVAESLIQPVEAEPDTSLEIESTSLVEGLEPTTGAGGGVLEGFETTSAEFGDIRLEAGDVPSLRDEVTAEDVAPLPELEPTVSDDASSASAEAELEALSEAELEIEIEPPAPAVPPPTPSPPPVKGAPGAAGGPGIRMPFTPRRPGVGTPPPVAAPPKVKPVVPKRPTPPPERKAVVEVPPLELEPDFDTATTDEGHEVDDAPLAIESDPSSRPGRRRSAAIDLGLDGTVRPADDAGSLVFANIEQPVAQPTIEELEARVADDPDDPEAHQALGEALIEAGERERGIEELDHATTGFENRGNLSQAQDLVDELLRLDPNSVRHRQKQVEFAFKSGDKPKLIEAYVELADTLLRSDLPDKARAVYQRVAEHDPGNARATAALSMLAPVAPAPPPAQPKGKAGAAAREEKTPARDAKMRVRDEVGEDGDFVDLGAMILADDLPERDTRMKVADEEPTGDEERDFQEMLARFKQGIDENIDEADFQSHYDLGVAFKEMGLLDEAIAELQKALRAPEGKLRSSEALGVCFIEKGAHVVAESILRRALELPASGDQERLGILYWLARALEEQGKRVEARDLYGRVFAVDIRFRDVGERAKALAKAK
ncbi:MAG TPA: tetratricopeptide repeat protein [Gemmatimonadales bacterium]|nr:tetratricopeptide repeat protein [Gemmatimonadales bacterium]